jgi:hypothetical protein
MLAQCLFLNPATIAGLKKLKLFNTTLEEKYQSAREWGF